MSVIWITGLSGAGKTTLAKELVKNLSEMHRNAILIDGDEIREVLIPSHTSESSFDRNNRLELAIKYSRLANLLSKQGHIVIVATISLFKEIHEWNRFNIHDYIEIYLKVPLNVLRERDSKGIYKKYDSGLLKNVSGLDLPIDEPSTPDLVLHSSASLTHDLEEVMRLISTKQL